MKFPIRYAAVTDTLRVIDTFPSIPAAERWASQACDAEFAIFFVSQQLPGARIQVGEIRSKYGSESTTGR